MRYPRPGHYKDNVVRLLNQLTEAGLLLVAHMGTQSISINGQKSGHSAQPKRASSLSANKLTNDQQPLGAAAASVLREKSPKTRETRSLKEYSKCTSQKSAGKLFKLL